MTTSCSTSAQGGIRLLADIGEPVGPMTARTVTVVGSVNADFIASVTRRAKGGETVLATDFSQRSGGKAANQAAAAARAGARVTFIGAVGDDSIGQSQIAELKSLGIDVADLSVIVGKTTGMAFITVTPDGENSIVVVPGANEELSPETVVTALRRSAPPAVLVLQSEVSALVIDAAAAWAAEREVRVVFNDGPCVAVATATLAVADPLVVNQHEARELCEDSLEYPDLATGVQARTGARSVIVTLGSGGVLVRSDDELDSIPATAVDAVVDTTGAGDTFVGTLAAALSEGAAIGRAARSASAAAALAVTWVGARP